MSCIIDKYEAHFDPKSLIDYGRNWGDAADGTPGWLHKNEVITSSLWKITADNEDPPALVLGPQGNGIDTAEKATYIFLQGGTEGIVYKLTNTIDTYDNDTALVRRERRSGLVLCVSK